MDIRKIKTLQDVEVIIRTWYSALPNLPKNIRNALVEVLPYLVFFIGVLFIGFSIIPFINPQLNFEPIKPDALLQFNVILLRFTYGLIGAALLFQFKLVSEKHAKGWYNLFYISLIQLLLSLIFFNLYSVASVLLVWYILFQIKPRLNKLKN